MEKISPPWRIAHRGALQESPDNTASALKRALAYPIDGVEFDVQMSADSVPVLYHDRTLWRLMRRRKRISNLTFSELQALDWGAWFHSDFAGEPVLTLHGALTLLNKCPRLMVEIKSCAWDRRSGHINRLTQKVISILKCHKYQRLTERIFILSFDPDVLLLAHSLAPEFRYVLNISADDARELKDLPRALIGNLWAVDMNIGKLSNDWARWIERRKLHLMAYTCNNNRQVQKALDLGVEAIISDRPQWLASFLRQ
jgi:glycerophosphoryl diester phosphodiesterase